MKTIRRSQGTRAGETAADGAHRAPALRTAASGRAAPAPNAAPAPSRTRPTTAAPAPGRTFQEESP